MTPGGDKTFVGFGFGPIQAGLFVLEALRSGEFRRLVVAEVIPSVVQSVRANGGFFSLNVAHAEHVETFDVGPVEMLNPADEVDRDTLVDAVAEATEVATAVPSVGSYRADNPGSIHRVLARGLTTRAGKPAVVYAAENHNHAAEILADTVLQEVPPDSRRVVRDATSFVNTVIGKMSGTITDPEEVKARGLKTIAPGDPRALLVEAFNRILVSRPLVVETRLPRAIAVFEEKDELLPFEEAKLYGHNATHALAGYLSARCGLQRLEELREVPGARRFLRAAFIEEAGTALLAKHRGVDPLFTEEGFAAYADDLLCRMLNPFLGDRTDRVIRDPERKLGWNDRLVGTMRLALAAGVEPKRFALGTAAALAYLDPRLLADREDAANALESLWREERSDAAIGTHVVGLVEKALQLLRTLNLRSLFCATDW